MNAEAEFSEALSKPEVLNSRLRLLWVSCASRIFSTRRIAGLWICSKGEGVKVLFREHEGSHVSTFGAVS